MKDKIEILEQKEKEAAEGGGKARIKKQHDAGKLTARERVELLVDKNTFVELDKFVVHRCNDFGMGDKKIPGDGVITGYGTVESAVDAIKKGAYDFVPKPFKMDELEVIIGRALEKHTLLRQLGVFRGLTLALLVSIPIWLVMGIVMAIIWK